MNGMSEESIRSCLVEADRTLFFASFSVLSLSSLSLGFYFSSLFYYVKYSSNFFVHVYLRVSDLDRLLDTRESQKGHGIRIFSVSHFGSTPSKNILGHIILKKHTFCTHLFQLIYAFFFFFFFKKKTIKIKNHLKHVI
jgi:hypothetical protein